MKTKQFIFLFFISFCLISCSNKPNGRYEFVTSDGEVRFIDIISDTTAILGITGKESLVCKYRIEKNYIFFKNKLSDEGIFEILKEGLKNPGGDLYVKKSDSNVVTNTSKKDSVVVPVDTVPLDSNAVVTRPNFDGKYRIEYNNQERTTSYLDSKGSGALFCQTDSKGINFFLIMTFLEREGKIVTKSIFLSCEKNFNPSKITFKTPTGKKIEWKVCMLAMNPDDNISISYYLNLSTDDVNHQDSEDPTRLLEFLKNNKIEKIMIEDTDTKKWAVQGVSNPNYFIEYFSAVQAFSLNQQEKI